MILKFIQATLPAEQNKPAKVIWIQAMHITSLTSASRKEGRCIVQLTNGTVLDVVETAHELLVQL